MTNSLGIDASEMDGVINWNTTASRGIQFATIRATWSFNKQDSKFVLNTTEAQANAIRVIPYHWYVPRINPLAQASNFCATIEGSQPLYCMVDLEDTRYVKAYVGIANEIISFCENVMLFTGQRPILYASPNYIKSYLTKYIELISYPLVIAHWDTPAPLIPRPFIPTNYLAWQFTAKANAPYYGITQCKQASLYVWNGEL